jgi:hypothetical protein
MPKEHSNAKQLTRIILAFIIPAMITEELAFFMHVKCQSMAKVCVRCNQKVRLQEHKKICATCSQALEYGVPSNPDWAVPIHWPVG